MAATGLEKGGIYRHFESKHALALAAFDRNAVLMAQRFEAAVRPHRHAVDRLMAVIGVFSAAAKSEPVPGGCPILNTAIEADDTDPVLCERANKAMSELRQLIITIVRKGQERGEVRVSAEPEVVATAMLAMGEGALMLAKLDRDPVHMDRAVGVLKTYLESAVRA